MTARGLGIWSALASPTGTYATRFAGRLLRVR
jgi:hypothetical protein